MSQIVDGLVHCIWMDMHWQLEYVGGSMFNFVCTIDLFGLSWVRIIMDLIDLQVITIERLGSIYQLQDWMTCKKEMSCIILSRIASYQVLMDQDSIHKNNY